MLKPGGELTQRSRILCRIISPRLCESPAPGLISESTNLRIYESTNLRIYESTNLLYESTNLRINDGVCNNSGWLSGIRLFVYSSIRLFALVLFVVIFTSDNRKGAIELLEQNNARQFVRKGHR